MSINRVCLSGNLTREPELRQTQGGTGVLNFGIAVNDRRKNSQTGEWEDYANFVDVIVFGKRAEGLANIMHKGMKISLEGKLHYSSWTKDEQKRSKLEVIADDIELMSQRNSQSQQNGSYGQQQQPQANYSQQQQYAPQNAPQQPTGAYQQQGYQQQGYQQQAPQTYQQAPQAQPQARMDVYDTDIPF